MRIIFINLFVPLFLVINVHAGVEDIDNMKKMSNGKFKVLCSNGKRETVSAASIMDNKVCGNSGHESTASFVCTGDQKRNAYFITRMSDRMRMGRNLTFDKCQKAISYADKGLVCTGNEKTNVFFMTDTSNGERIGRNMTFERCLDAIKGGR